MKYLQSKSDIASGDLTIKGTRILVADVITMIANGYSIEQLHETWPHVPVKTIQGALEEATQHLTPKIHV